MLTDFFEKTIAYGSRPLIWMENIIFVDIILYISTTYTYYLSYFTYQNGVEKADGTYYWSQPFHWHPGNCKMRRIYVRKGSSEIPRLFGKIPPEQACQ